MNQDARTIREALRFLLRNAFLYFYAWAGGIISIHKQTLRSIDRIVKNGDAIIEIGCGRGFFTKALHEKMSRMHDVTITASDINPKVVEHAARYCGAEYFPPSDAFFTEDNSLEIRLASATNIGSTVSKKADVILCIMVAHHLSHCERQQMIKGIYEALGPGRTALVVDHGKPSTWYGKIFWLLFHHHCFANGCIESIEEMAEKQGFINRIYWETQFGWIHHLTIQRPLNGVPSAKQGQAN